MPIVHGRGANRCPEVAARTRFTERKCAQVLTRRCCGSHLPRTVSLQHSDPRVVHHENHCGGSALLGNSAYNAGGARETECQTAGLAGTERSEKAGGSQGANGLNRECAVSIDGCCAWGHVLRAHAFERRFVRCYGWSHLSSRFCRSTGESARKMCVLRAGCRDFSPGHAGQFEFSECKPHASLRSVALQFRPSGGAAYLRVKQRAVAPSWIRIRRSHWCRVCKKVIALTKRAQGGDIG